MSSSDYVLLKGAWIADNALHGLLVKMVCGWFCPYYVRKSSQYLGFYLSALCICSLLMVFLGLFKLGLVDAFFFRLNSFVVVVIG